MLFRWKSNQVILCKIEQLTKLEDCGSCLSGLITTHTVRDRDDGCTRLNALTPNTVSVREQQLERSLQQFGERWELNPGDGAFYGPKVSLSSH